MIKEGRTGVPVRIKSWNRRSDFGFQLGKTFINEVYVRYETSMFVFSSHLFFDVRLMGVPAGVTQEEGHTGFLIHLPSAVLALIFLARRIHPFLSLVDREVEFCVLTIYSLSTSHDTISRPPYVQQFQVKTYTRRKCSKVNFHGSGRIRRPSRKEQSYKNPPRTAIAYQYTI